MSRFNLVYTPTESSFAAKCIELATSVFGRVADGYLLQNESAIPHVTLAQFEGSREKLEGLWLDVRQTCPQRISLTIDLVYCQRGRDEHQDYIWIGFGISREKVLVDHQRQIVSRLRSDFNPITKAGDDYFPHLTLARIRNTPDTVIPQIRWASAEFALDTQEFCLALGPSDPNGVLLDIWYSYT